MDYREHNHLAGVVDEDEDEIYGSTRESTRASGEPGAIQKRVEEGAGGLRSTTHRVGERSGAVVEERAGLL